MIYSGLIPTICCMARGAVRAERPLMTIIFHVAGIAILRRSLEYVIDVALLTRNIDMFTGQLESREIVIEISWLPAIGRVTSSAVLAEAACMWIIFLMAGKTIRRRRRKIF